MSCVIRTPFDEMMDCGPLSGAAMMVLMQAFEEYTGRSVHSIYVPRRIWKRWCENDVLNWGCELDEDLPPTHLFGAILYVGDFPFRLE